MKAMGFVVDKVSEDSFYENLLLGLSKVLEKNPCISNLSLKRLSGVRQIEIRSWEHNNGIILPEDLRAFYFSTNGFLYTYDFSYDYSTGDQRLIRQGKIEVNPLEELVRTYGYETKNLAQVEQIGKKYKLTLSRDSKVFELCTVDDHAKVVLVYTTSYSIPSIWLYTASMSFSFLAEDFTIYFRMCIAHLGIPCWQYIVSKDGLPEWTKEMFLLIAPGVLSEDRNLIEVPKFNLDDVNKIDVNIFTSNSSVNERSAALQGVQQNKVKEKKVKGAPKRHVSAKPGKKVGM
nr:tubulin polyglutamylase complex subunit 2 isoform X1 [Leptinotarsa decemlineata]